MNSHQLRNAINDLECLAGELSDVLRRNDRRAGDAERIDALRKIARELAGMQRDLVEGQWEGRSIEG